MIGREGPKVVWLIYHGLPTCAALDRLRPVNASEAVAYQRLKGVQGLGPIRGRKIGLMDATGRLEAIEEGREYEPSLAPTEEDDDEGIIPDQEESSPLLQTRRGRQ